MAKDHTKTISWVERGEQQQIRAFFNGSELPGPWTVGSAQAAIEAAIDGKDWQAARDEYSYRNDRYKDCGGPVHDMMEAAIIFRRMLVFVLFVIFLTSLVWLMQV